MSPSPSINLLSDMTAHHMATIRTFIIGNHLFRGDIKRGDFRGRQTESASGGGGIAARSSSSGRVGGQRRHGDHVASAGDFGAFGPEGASGVERDRRGGERNVQTLEDFLRFLPFGVVGSGIARGRRSLLLLLKASLFLLFPLELLMPHLLQLGLLPLQLRFAVGHPLGRM